MYQSFHNLTETTLKQKPQAARIEARSCYRTLSDSKHSIHTCPHQKSHSLTIYGFTACSGKHSVLFGCSEHTMRRTQLNPLYIENTSDEKWHFFFSNYARLSRCSKRKIFSEGLPQQSNIGIYIWLFVVVALGLRCCCASTAARFNLYADFYGR